MSPTPASNPRAELAGRGLRTAAGQTPPLPSYGRGGGGRSLPRLVGDCSVTEVAGPSAGGPDHDRAWRRIAAAANLMADPGPDSLQSESHAPSRSSPSLTLRVARVRVAPSRTGFTVRSHAPSRIVSHIW